MSWENWFQKAITREQGADETDNTLGGITDHYLSAYQRRQALRPMVGDELKAFDWIIAKLKKDFPDFTLADLIDEGESLGWFYSDDNGMLRVSKELPK